MERSVLVRRFGRGESIVEPNQPAEAVFIVHSGTVELRLSGAPDQALGPGEMFGEAALVLGEPYGLQAVALTETEVVAVTLPDLQRLCLENQDFTFRLIRQLARGSWPRSTEDGNGPRQRAGRLAAVILDLALEGDPPVRVDGRLRDLAEAAELPIQEAYVWVQRWLEQRMLRLTDDQLSLVEPDALRAVAEPPSDSP